MRRTCCWTLFVVTLIAKERHYVLLGVVLIA
jgi:hypothetical protein